MERDPRGWTASALKLLATNESLDILADAYTVDLLSWAEHFATDLLP